MNIKQATRGELEARRLSLAHPWFDAVCDSLRELPLPPFSRVLVAENKGRPCAVLGLSLQPMDNGRKRRARICALGIDPAHSREGLGSLLVRFAEGIARLHGCHTVEVAPYLEGWGDGRCWPGLEYHDDDECMAKGLRTAPYSRCA
jgi:GNAT superfamily N-acetyltransferase